MDQLTYESARAVIQKEYID